ncbi:hypothetical protein [Polynucleobacter arcticus]|uniref:Uncharacterized protein n=1 Tax=Polynucleobacter arcticus TaxID=1743165 RepID=A0A6M9PDM2_9BURK|nr:hypothetical protein [Polynucleobacter arcticus]QKM60880.1 hypothetical protein DN92_07470 [Polynucleobacter arcticus]
MNVAKRIAVAMALIIGLGGFTAHATMAAEPVKGASANIKPLDIILLCKVSGTATQTITGKERVVTKISGQDSYLFANESYGWGVSINGEAPIRYTDTSGDKDFRRVSSVQVSEQLLEISDNVWTRDSYINKDGVEQGALDLKQMIRINRISGALESSQSIGYRYKSGAVSVTVRELTGICSPVSRKF